MTLEFGDVATIAATVISLVALAVSLSEIMANRPKLRISGDPVFFSAGNIKRAFQVSITNHGRQPTTITGVNFKPSAFAKVGPKGGQLVTVPLWEISTKLPHVLEVGRTVNVYFDLDSVVVEGPPKITLRHLIIAKTFKVLVRSAWHSKPQFGPVKPGRLAEWKEPN